MLKEQGEACLKWLKFGGMNFGKLHVLTQVDFSLPPDHERTTRVLARALQSPHSQRKIYLGATGWSNKEWVGSMYPPKAKPPEYLSHYSRIFNTIEFNTTHYRIPNQDLVQRWHDVFHARRGFDKKAANDGRNNGHRTECQWVQHSVNWC